jgi:hypothetical protein
MAVKKTKKGKARRTAKKLSSSKKLGGITPLKYFGGQGA